MHGRRRDISDEDLYEVEKIVGAKVERNGEMFYQIKWRDYQVSESTWEPRRNLANLEEFTNSYDRKLQKVIERNLQHRILKRKTRGPPIKQEANVQTDLPVPTDPQNNPECPTQERRTSCKETPGEEMPPSSDKQESILSMTGLHLLPPKPCVSHIKYLTAQMQYCVLFSDGSEQLMSKKDASVKCPLECITFLESHIQFKKEAL